VLHLALAQPVAEFAARLRKTGPSLGHDFLAIEKFGRETVYIRSGGSIPIVGVFDATSGSPA
jgi:hypothetical protein